jgi:DNA polymerase (family X)
MTNLELATIFRRLADLMELREENIFKLRSYRNAADVIEDHPTPLADLFSAGGVVALQTLPGIGAAISQKIADLLTTGTFKAYERIQSEIPLSTLDLLLVEGVGMKTAQVLYRQFQLTNLEDFAKFIAGGGLDCVPHLGERTQEKMRASVTVLLAERGASAT